MLVSHCSARQSLPLAMRRAQSEAKDVNENRYQRVCLKPIFFETNKLYLELGFIGLKQIGHHL